MTRTDKKVSHAPERKPPCLTPGGSAERVQRAFAMLDGRWKLPIVFELFAAPVLRFSELERALGGVSQKVLTQQLRELERDGIVRRTVHAEVPPRVDYRLTAAGEALRPVLRQLREWIDLPRDTDPG